MITDPSEWAKKLKDVPGNAWRESTAHEKLYRKFELLHLKFYDSGERDGFNPQPLIIPTGETILEQPYKRQLFHPSTGRFALKKPQLVSFWARDHAVATSETDPHFRNELPMSIADFWKRQESIPIPVSRMGYLAPRRINSQAAFLDLTRPDRPFINELVNIGLCNSSHEFMSELVMTRDEAVYPITHEISEAALAASFDGIVWASGRAPAGVINHVMVVFHEHLIESPKYFSE